MSPNEADVQRTLGRLEGKLDMLLSRSDAGELRDDEYDKRLIKVEGEVSTAKKLAAGVAAAIALAGTAAANILPGYFIK